MVIKKSNNKRTSLSMLNEKVIKMPFNYECKTSFIKIHIHALINPRAFEKSKR